MTLLTPMIDSKLFASIRKDIEKYDQLREIMIKKARDLLKSSKLLIYSIHRKKDTAKYLKEVKKQRVLLDNIIKKDKNLSNEGAYSDACQEYAEGMTYYHYTKGKLVSAKEIKVSGHDYLLGLCDLTGELARRAVMLAIESKTKEIEKIQKFVAEIYLEFLKFSFRNGNLRKKSDQIKWNLKKIEEVLYDMKKK